MTVNDSAGSPIQGAKVQIEDYDNGNRQVVDTLDYTADNDFNETTDSNGDVSGNMWLYVISQEIIAGVTQGAESDYRSKNNNNTDEFDVYVCGYTYNIFIIPTILKGVGGFSADYTLVDDILITQATKATVDAYTSLETAQKIYDRAKAELFDNYARETNVLVGRVGNQVDLEGGSSTALVLDSTAVLVIDYTGTTLTCDLTSDYTGGCTGTGTFTISGAHGLNGGTFDNSGGVSYDTSATTITDVTCTGTMDFTTAGTYTIDGCTINEVTNSSGGAVTITAIGGTTITTNTGPSITINYEVDLSVDGLVADSNVRIEKVSDGSLISQGNEATTEYTDTYNYTGDLPVKIIVRKYGYLANEFNGTITSAGLSAPASQVSEPFVVANEATALAITGITEDFSAGTVQITSSVTMQELFDYLNARAAVLTNLQYDTLISTVNGDTRTGTFGLTIDTGQSLNGEGALDINGNTLTLSGTGTYGDDVIILHSAGTNVTILLTGVASNRSYRIEKQSDQSLVYEGTCTATTESIKHLHTGDVTSTLITGEYGYLRFGINFTISDSNSTIQVTNQTDSYVVASEAAAGAYTGISLNYSARTGTMSSNHTVQELYDYERYQQAQLANLTYEPLTETNNGLEVHLHHDLTLSTTAVLSSSTQSIGLADTYSLTVASGTGVSCDISISTNGQLVAADIDDVTGAVTMTSTGDWEIGAAGTAPTGSAGASATIEITGTNPDDTFDFAAFDFDASTVLENSSGNNINVNVLSGA
ncbi:hypothetical protein OAG36_01190, partial [bacterium]|nr:hypothetical protein [bacterium]